VEQLIRVQSVCVGRPVVIMERDGATVKSAIEKYRLPVQSLVISQLNIEGDAQADLVNHGGVDKAVYVYPAEHLPKWKDEIGYDGGDASFGENLSITGMLEAEARIGDIWQWGSVTLQISQPRWPCFKLAYRTGHRDMVKRLVRSLRSGWSLRVLATGTTSESEPIRLVQADPLGITVERAFRARAGSATLDEAERALIVSHPALARAWREGLA
jgi:MOSC domain-containing protein YiiM